MEDTSRQEEGEEGGGRGRGTVMEEVRWNWRRRLPLAACPRS